MNRSVLRNGLAAWGMLALAWWAAPASGAAQEAREGQEAAEPEAPAAAEEAAATPPAFPVTLLRTWTPSDDGDLTIVDGLAQVPLSIMAGSTTDAYRFELTVFDSEGTQLYRDSWERSLSDRATAYAGAASSTMLEPFRFGVRPGEYEIELLVYPTDAPDLGTRTRLPIVAYADRPVASDLFLADRVEPLDEEGGGSWSITHGGFGISAVARTTVLPRQPTLYYYLELYGDEDAAASVELTAEVVDEKGRVLYTTPASVQQVPVGGLPFAGSLSLAGLPPGEYVLRLGAAAPSDTAVRSAPFRVLEPEDAAGMLPTSDEGRYFASLSDRELEDIFGGVGYLVSESERQAFESLPPDAQRRYLTQFFASRDATVGDGNPFLEEYIRRVGTVRMKYGELVGTSERPPWLTDAGLLYIQYGEPAERIVNHFPLGSDMVFSGGGSSQGSAPYEIWSYHSTGFVYLFIQENQFGVWRLIYTNDPNRQSLANWSRRIGREAIEDLTTKFGIRPRL